MPYYSNPETIPTLLEALNNYSVEQLKKLLPLLQTREKPNRKAELVEVVFDYLQDNNLSRLWQQLDTIQQAAVAEIVHSFQSQFNENQFAAKYGQLPNFGKVERYGNISEPSLLKLFFYNYNIMPEDLKNRLKTFVPAPKTTNIKTVSDLPKSIKRPWEKFDWETRQNTSGIEEISLEIRPMERTAFNDLQTLLRLIKAGKITVSDKTRYPTTAIQTTLTKLLSGGDYYTEPPEKEREPYEQVIGTIRAFALPIILQAADLAELSGKKLRLTAAGEKALSNCSEKTIKAIWKKWLKTNFLDEFRRINEIKGQTGKGQKGFTALAGRRQTIASGLLDCPVGEWVGIDDFFRYLIATGNTFLVSRQTEYLYLCEAGYGSLYDLGREWSILEERYTLCFLLEYAATLGIIDVAYIHPSGSRQNYNDFWGVDDFEFLSRYDGLLYFRLTPLGAYCLDLTPNYTALPLEIRSVLKVLPNLEIVVTDNSLTTADILVLEQYAKKISDNIWQLEQGKLLTVTAEGNSVLEFQKFLQARCDHPLPETVLQLLKDIQGKTESLKDKGTGRLIECIDASLAVLIAKDSRTKNYCLLAGEKSLVIPLECETKFRNALQKLGYTLPK
jgi:hypothetical protein